MSRNIWYEERMDVVRIWHVQKNGYQCVKKKSIILVCFFLTIFQLVFWSFHWGEECVWAKVSLGALTPHRLYGNDIGPVFILLISPMTACLLSWSPDIALLYLSCCLCCFAARFTTSLDHKTKAYIYHNKHTYSSKSKFESRKIVSRNCATRR